jgi:hypothetical protein
MDPPSEFFIFGQNYDIEYCCLCPNNYWNIILSYTTYSTVYTVYSSYHSTQQVNRLHVPFMLHNRICLKQYYSPLNTAYSSCLKYSVNILKGTMVFIDSRLTATVTGDNKNTVGRKTLKLRIYSDVATGWIVRSSIFGRGHVRLRNPPVLLFSGYRRSFPAWNGCGLIWVLTSIQCRGWEWVELCFGSSYMSSALLFTFDRRTWL